MSFPVHIASWHERDEDKLSVAQMLISIEKPKCNTCSAKITLENCWANHSMCYIGVDNYWCSAFCMYEIAENLLSPRPETRAWAEEIYKTIKVDEAEGNASWQIKKHKSPGP